MNGEIFTDESMLEIFRAEVDAHVETLTSGLIELERNPTDTRHIDELMRGAHSIKGAARIVGIDPAVRIAHVIEDGFIAAQRGTLSIRPDQVDVLLRGTDMLRRIASATKASASDWQSFEVDATRLVDEITAALQSKAPIAVAATAAASEAVTTKSESAGSALPAVDKVRVISAPEMLDEIAAEEVRKQFVAAWDEGVARVSIDLRQTKDLDSTGLALLAMIPVQTQYGAPTVEIVGATTDIEFVLTATGVRKLYAEEAN
jgi:two-component system sensor histidine kinase and response regulator WspE